MGRPREDLAQLSDHPIRSWMSGHIDVQDPPSSVFDDEEALEQRNVTVGTVKKSKAVITSR